MSKRNNSLGLYILIVALGAVAVATKIVSKETPAPIAPQKEKTFASVQEEVSSKCSGPAAECTAMLNNRKVVWFHTVEKDGRTWVLLENETLPASEFYEKRYKSTDPNGVVMISYHK